MRRWGLAVVLLALIAPSSSVARTLSFHRARAVMRRNTAPDKPTRISINGCRRHSPIVIRCEVVEYGLVTSWTLDDQPITMTLKSLDTVTLYAHRIVDCSKLLFFSD